eukprot:357213-Chlamydomonas_euryale.AAC.1
MPQPTTQPALRLARSGRVLTGTHSIFMGILDTFDLHADPESGLMQHDAFVALLSASGFDDDEAAAVFAGLL